MVNLRSGGVPLRLSVCVITAILSLAFAKCGAQIAPGRQYLHTDSLNLELVGTTGIVAGLHPVAESAFDYVPGDLLASRSGDTFYHLGDVDLRVKRGASAWVPLSTAYRRAPSPVQSISGGGLLSDLTSSLSGPSGRASGIRLVRTWKRDGDELQLHYALTNTGSQPLQVGGLGIAMVFNNILNGRTLSEAYERCSFYDPYIGNRAGYVQTVPLKGNGAVLLVAPLGNSPLEAWKPILDRKEQSATSTVAGGALLGSILEQKGEGKPVRAAIENDPTPRSVTFEGSFDWMIHSAAFSETDWKDSAQQWNAPTSETLKPGETRIFGLRFFVAPGVRTIEATLLAHGQPVAIGVPGYVLPMDTDARLFLQYNKPVRSVVAVPAGTIAIKDDGTLASGAHAYTLRGRQWGSGEVRVTYADGLVQPIAYRVIKPEREAVADMGRFLTHQQWYTDRNDAFGRAPSILSYNNEAHAPVLQDTRAWIAGLSDEAGAGSYLATAMKEMLQPKEDEVTRLEEFVDGVLWGHLQVKDGPHRYGVRKSLFYYDPIGKPGYVYSPKVNVRAIWDRKEADRLDRTYNYPHVVSAYWALYRIARSTNGVVTHHPAEWYLEQAYQTTMAMKREAGLFDQYGMMEGTVFTLLLDDLQSEGRNAEAGILEKYMHERADRWKTEAYPFGSEMPWDSTGQEEVYAWSRRFGMSDKANVTLNAVLGYMPTISNWGYNGNARRYWDFGTAGKLDRLERMIHHYGSGLNAIPVLTEYRDHPEDLYLLRVGYGGTMGVLSNIDQNGFASVAFHSFPDVMNFDPYTGDYGSNFFGHSLNTATYVVRDSNLGWLAFGGNVQGTGNAVSVDVLDSARRRLFVAPLRLWLTLDAGEIETAEIDLKAQTVRLHLAPATVTTSTASFSLSATGGTDASQWSVAGAERTRKDKYSAQLSKNATVITFTRSK